MKNIPATLTPVLPVLLICCALRSTAAAEFPAPRIFTTSGVPTDPNSFPVAVWLQSPANAPRYKAAGINLYVGLWRGPTAEQLNQLRAAKMPVICDQNEVALANLADPIIAAWMHGDEPDNAQPLKNGKGYGPSIPPETIVNEYKQMRAADPSRPVILNLGQAVAWDGWIGRGVRNRHPEDYPQYIKGCDIASFDIYPVVHDSPAVAGKLEFVARGVERLSNWTGGQKPVWSCIECTHIGNPEHKATPDQVRAEVWMALTRGARGLIYFVHQFKPVFREAALLDDPPMLEAVTRINRQLAELAPVLNRPSLNNQLTVQSPSGTNALATMMKRLGSRVYVFAVNLRNEPVHADFTVGLTNCGPEFEVLGEARHRSVHARTFSDDFAPYAVHLYQGSVGP